MKPLEAGMAMVREGELGRLLLCERRLEAIVIWLEANQPDVFRRGLWDAIYAADARPIPDGRQS